MRCLIHLKRFKVDKEPHRYPYIYRREALEEISEPLFF